MCLQKSSFFVYKVIVRRAIGASQSGNFNFSGCYSQYEVHHSVCITHLLIFMRRKLLWELALGSLYYLFLNSRWQAIPLTVTVLHQLPFVVCVKGAGSGAGAVFSWKDDSVCLYQFVTSGTSFRLMGDTSLSHDGSSVETTANYKESNSYSNIGEDGLLGDSTVKLSICSYDETVDGHDHKFDSVVERRNLDSTTFAPSLASNGFFQQATASLAVTPDISCSLLCRIENQIVGGASEYKNEKIPLKHEVLNSVAGAGNILFGLNQVNVVHQLQSGHEQGVHRSNIHKLPQMILSTLYDQQNDWNMIDRQPQVEMTLEIDEQFSCPANTKDEEVEKVKHDWMNSRAGSGEINARREKDHQEEEFNIGLRSTIARHISTGEMKSTPAGHQILGKKTAEVAIETNTGFDYDISLREWLSKAGKFIDRVESLHIFRQIVEFVEIAHSQGVVLRNIRPSSFLLSSFNRVSFIDSAHTHTSSGSSEQSTGRAVNPAALAALRDHNWMDKSELPNTAGLSPLEQQDDEEQRTAVMSSFQQGADRSGTGHEGYGVKLQLQRLANKSGLPSNCSNSASDFSGNGGAQTVSSGERPNSGGDNIPGNMDLIQEAMKERFPLKQTLLMEQTWYTSHEELIDSTEVFASDIYSLGVLFFELFCSFGSEMEWSRAMSDLRHRVLPPRLLLEHPKEAAFCLWLLHPDPNSRPKASEVLQSDLLSEVGDELAERQAAINAEEKEVELEQTLEFLLQLQRQKKQALQLVSQDVAFITTDIEEVERRQSLLRQARGGKSKYMGDFVNWESGIVEQKTVVLGKRSYGQEESHTVAKDEENSLEKRLEVRSPKSARLMSRFGQLKQVYFSMREKVNRAGLDAAKGALGSGGKGKRSLNMGTSGFGASFDQQVQADLNSRDRLGFFLDGLCKYARYSRFEVKANLQHGDLLNTGNMVCSLSFDRDNEFFATAGVCKRIKVFEFDAILDGSIDIHYPVVELAARSKLSSICWNSYIKSHIASSDHDGVVQVWDVNTSQPFLELKEHDKRAWSVDFSQADPTKLVSGSDDCCVKLWCINQKSSVGTIKTKANVCCVQFSPNSHFLAFGSADHRILCYDLRNTRTPKHILAGHSKAVSFVRFIDSATLVSASTDNTLKLWDITKLGTTLLAKNACTLSFTGHTNEKNFVGLSIADGGYIACGSETHEVFAYHKSLPMPIMSHKFLCLDPISGQETEDDGGQFVSSVCWRGKSQTLLAANSMGNIKVLEMV